MHEREPEINSEEIQSIIDTGSLTYRCGNYVIHCLTVIGRRGLTSCPRKQKHQI
jgi:hypothetical protein